MTTPTPQGARSRNINVWRNAEVYTSTDLNAQVNADGTFDAEVWSFFGLLGSGTSIGQELDITRNDIQSFGGSLEMKDDRFNKDSRTVTALEDNETNFAILWPGSEWVAEGATVLMAPDAPAEVIVAFKTTNSYGDVLIDVSRRPAFAFSTGSGTPDEGASTTEFTFEVPKDDEGALYDRLKIRADGTVEGNPEPIRIAGTGTAPDASS